MVVIDLFSVIHAAVTDLDCITIKDFSMILVFREMLVYLGKESMSDIQSINKLYFKCLKNIGANVFAERGVVPEYVVLLSVFSFVSCRWFVM